MEGPHKVYLNCGAQACRRVFISLVLLFSFPALGDTNSWTKPTSGYWEEQAYWSLGVLPDSSQSVLFSNPGWKALAIGPNTARNFPDSMRIQVLHIESPADSYNTLLMNFSGLEQPLQATSVIVGSNSAVVMQASAFEVIATSTDGTTGNLLLGGTFQHGDYSQVKIERRLEVGRGTHGAYFLTNGTLSAESEFIGQFTSPGVFSQYGGFHTAGALSISTGGEFNMLDGQLTVTNGITVGTGGFADYSNFYQYGGNVSADTAINGRYFLYGGTLTGRMQIIMPTYQWVDAAVVQAGGTNSASSLDIGQPNRFGGKGFYTLSNGVLRVDSSLTFRGGSFVQYAGLNTIASNLFMLGTDIGVGIAYADYNLRGGTLSAAGLTQRAARFQQDGGSNLLRDDLVLIGTSLTTYGSHQNVLYTLTGGFLSARNIIVDGIYDGGFLQTGGSCQIAEKLTLRNILPGAFYYTLESGTLAVKDIEILAGAFFQHTGGTIIHSGMLTLNQGAWHAATGDHVLGPVQLAGQNTNSAIVFPSGSSILRLANSSGQAWSSTATLCITNWHGSISGGGDTQLFFGSDANGLTTQQLALLKFCISGGVYSARLLPTGEVVPQMQSLNFSRSGSTLTLSWDAGWTLNASTNVAGPYQPVLGATSPYSVSMDQPAQFFQLRQ